MSLLAHRIISLQVGASVAFGAQRTSDGWQRGLAGSQMTLADFHQDAEANQLQGGVSAAH
jgi:hypothetical protein